jgi:hypothetical protein
VLPQGAVTPDAKRSVDVFTPMREPEGFVGLKVSAAWRPVQSVAPFPAPHVCQNDATSAAVDQRAGPTWSEGAVRSVAAAQAETASEKFAVARGMGTKKGPRSSSGAASVGSMLQSVQRSPDAAPSPTSTTVPFESGDAARRQAGQSAPVVKSWMPETSAPDVGWIYVALTRRQLARQR